MGIAVHVQLIIETLDVLDTVDRRHFFPRRVLKKLRSDAGSVKNANS